MVHLFVLCWFFRSCVFMGWWGWCIILWRDVLLVLIRRRNDTKRTSTRTVLLSISMTKWPRFSICLLVHRSWWFLPLWIGLVFLITYIIVSTSKYPFQWCYRPKIARSLRQKRGHIRDQPAEPQNLVQCMIFINFDDMTTVGIVSSRRID